ncbi:MAG: Asp-tRNA(Asn)/Glu-tRNA(Gln) amidotransferase subunit GatB [Chloroflexi bacterium]|nr:Asp-tRNA(Asn)/Glu-tRNA(Gln) amidotransferase subunit GatB [Chloroflexota bacterium]
MPQRGVIAILCDVVNYETVIGLEVHSQLLTKSKMYCACSADYASALPNTHVCPVCMGMPGVLPTINQRAIEFTLMTALALNCSIPEHAKFDRKNYPYPDLMKGYQISQYDAPVGVKGYLVIDVEGKKKKIGITRLHLEEDVAKLVHRNTPEGETYSLVDINRAGMPLMEIVSEPDMSSPEEARLYLVKLRAILQYLGVSTGNMEEGSFRCDANISIRPVGTTEYLSKVEVKNMNSFRAVYRALEYEAQRQRDALASGERIVQETRGWVDDKGVTVSQRSKEYAHDYRYFPEPDLPPMAFSREMVQKIEAELPDLPEKIYDDLIAEYNLPPYDAEVLTQSKHYVAYFTTSIGLKSSMSTSDRQKRAKTISNWLLGEFTRLLNAKNVKIEEAKDKVTPENLSGLIDLVDKGTLSGPLSKTVFEEMFNSGKPAGIIVEEKGLVQISDTSEISNISDKVIAENEKAVTDYRAGKEQSLTFIIGQVMKASKGKANPAVVRQIILDKLGGK